MKILLKTLQIELIKILKREGYSCLITGKGINIIRLKLPSLNRMPTFYLKMVALDEVVLASKQFCLLSKIDFTNI